MRRALFWLTALIAAPLLGIVATGPATGYGSDGLAWLLLLGVPPVVTVLASRIFTPSHVELAIAAILSAIVSVLVLVLLLWYALSVGGLN